MILGILGRARVGKDTAADIATGSFGYTMARLSAPVKAACVQLFGLDPVAQMEGPEKDIVDPRYGVTPRDLLVWMTKNVQANFPSTFFMTRLLDTHGGKDIVIPDVRYQADVDEIRRLGGKILKIRRPGEGHAHEDHIDAILADAVLENDGDKILFEKRVMKTLEWM